MSVRYLNPQIDIRLTKAIESIIFLEYPAIEISSGNVGKQQIYVYKKAEIHLFIF